MDDRSVKAGIVTVIIFVSAAILTVLILLVLKRQRRNHQHRHRHQLQCSHLPSPQRPYRKLSGTSRDKSKQQEEKEKELQREAIIRKSLARRVVSPRPPRDAQESLGPGNVTDGSKHVEANTQRQKPPAYLQNHPALCGSGDNSPHPPEQLMPMPRLPNRRVRLAGPPTPGPRYPPASYVPPLLGRHHGTAPR